ncbi:ABC transporter permease [Aureimonas populi]|uniref:ABC transporter permease n=1 Tax=Aureimonas populi TaxID=1701758 RepID=A0ABW5CMC0_9HYPH|nr:ABC transporter permease [Aureimonas populi]
MSRPYVPLPGWINHGLIPLVNVAVAFLVAGLVVLAVGESPVEAARLMLRGAFGYSEGFGFTLYYTTNFILTGLAVAVAFHGGLFNIGGEGQVYLGGLGVALVALNLDGTFPWWVNLPLAILASAAFGALWALIPAVLQARRGSHIVITTIMFNFIASALMVYLIVGPLRPVGTMQPESRRFLEGGQLPKLGPLFERFGLDLGGAPLNVTFFVALLAAFLVWVLIWRTRLGYEIRTLGFSPSAARYAGMSQVRLVVIIMLISGGLAGMMALNPVMGDQYRLQIDFPAGAGFVGIAVALMGRGHPAGIVPAALLFGVLYQGGAELAFDMPAISRDMIVIIQGLVILFAGALENMLRPGIGAAFQAVRFRSPRAGGVEGRA